MNGTSYFGIVLKIPNLNLAKPIPKETLIYIGTCHQMAMSRPWRKEGEKRRRISEFLSTESLFSTVSGKSKMLTPTHDDTSLLSAIDNNVHATEATLSI